MIYSVRFCLVMCVSGVSGVFGVCVKCVTVCFCLVIVWCVCARACHSVCMVYVYGVCLLLSLECVRLVAYMMYLHFDLWGVDLTFIPSLILI